jgi:hypothetical protein
VPVGEGIERTPAQVRAARLALKEIETPLTSGR